MHMMKSLWMVAVLVLCTGLTSADGDDKKEEPKPKQYKIESPSKRFPGQIGKTLNITWMVQGADASPDTVYIFYRFRTAEVWEDSQRYNPIGGENATGVPNTGSYEWEIGKNFTEGQYTIRICSLSDCDKPKEEAWPMLGESETFKIFEYKNNGTFDPDRDYYDAAADMTSASSFLTMVGLALLFASY